jgi:hypothetical protein
VGGVADTAQGSRRALEAWKSAVATGCSRRLTRQRSAAGWLRANVFAMTRELTALRARNRLLTGDIRRKTPCKAPSSVEVEATTPSR